MQARIPGTCDRSPASVVMIDKDHVIEMVRGLEAEDQGRIAMLLEDHGGRERRFQAVRLPQADHLTEAALGGAVWFGIIRELVQPSLDVCGRVARGNQTAFGRRKKGWDRGRWHPDHGERRARFGRSCVTRRVASWECQNDSPWSRRRLSQGFPNAACAPYGRIC